MTADLSRRTVDQGDDGDLFPPSYSSALLLQIKALTQA